MRYALACFGFLFWGLCLYWLFRSCTYLHRVLPPAPDFHLPAFLSIFCACYLPDFLWSAALSCALFCLLLPQGHQRLAPVILSASVGMVWELCQKCGLIPGTGDWVDCMLYIMGAYVPILINKKVRKKK